MRIIDALIYIQEELGHSFAFRYSCKRGKCGTCGVLVNGEPKLPCWEPVEKEMTIEPLPNFPVIRDLVVDRSSYDKGRRRMKLFLKRIEAPDRFPEDIGPNETNIRELRHCLEWLLCVSQCPVHEVKWKNFAGPTLMVQLARFALDARDELDRIPMTFSEGVFDCTTCKKCQEVCPTEIPIPKIGIEKLRTLTVEGKIGPLDPHRKIAQRIIETGRAIDRTHTTLLEKIPENTKPKRAAARVGYFTGCLVDYRLQDVGKALLQLLKKNDVEVVVPHDQICCGSPLLRTGQMGIVTELAQRNIELFERLGVDTVITSCAGCAATLRLDYPEFSEKIFGRPMNFKVLHFAEYMTKFMPLNKQEMKPIKLKVTYHDSCHLRRGLGIFRDPRTLLASIPGVKFIEMQNPDSCCGAGGGVRAGKRDLSSLIANRKAEQISRTGAEVVVSCCPFCQVQLGEVSRMKAIDIAEILRMAYN